MNRLFIALLTGFAAFVICTIDQAHALPISGQGTWETTLQGRDLDGNATTFEAYYDTLLDVTWLADANFAMTSGFDDDGLMTWDVANTWATTLDVFGITGWRLPSETPHEGTTFKDEAEGFVLSIDGSTNFGLADGVGWVDASGNHLSEIGAMFYLTLGNHSIIDPLNYGFTNTGPFSNIMETTYWSGTQFEIDNSDVAAQAVIFISEGYRLHGPRTNEHLAWVVRDGDILAEPSVPVPEPSTVFLLGAGVLGLTGWGRRKFKRR